MDKIERHKYKEEQDGMMTHCKYCGYGSSHTIHCLDESLTKDIRSVRIRINNVEKFHYGYRVSISMSHLSSKPLWGEVGGTFILNEGEEHIWYLD